MIVSQSRQENFSRTVWMTFHARGITSSVSVTSSPSFDRRVPPQAGQEHGAGTTTRSRGRCSGNGFLAGRLRSKAVTLAVLLGRGLGSEIVLGRRRPRDLRAAAPSGRAGGGCARRWRRTARA